MFQFPSNGKDFPNSAFRGKPDVSEHWFQFPSNGKDFPNLGSSYILNSFVITVSIPFKREGLSEQKETHMSTYQVSRVSIPFKREGLSERGALRLT